MRLWHEALLPHLPRQQLLGQHRECCAMRGNSWGKKHATVDYVFKYPYRCLYQYHLKVIKEMKNRGYHVDPLWLRLEYRGKNCPPCQKDSLRNERQNKGNPQKQDWIYPEHNQEYLQECFENLMRKGIILSTELLNHSKITQ